MLSLSLVVSLLIFALIAVRQWLPDGLRIWHIMVAGAVVLLATGEIAPGTAVRAVDWNVIAYLFGVFSIAAALYDCGVSHALGARLARHPSDGHPFAAFILVAALCAAVLTNDAAAVIGTPIALMLARARGWPPVVPLVALCAAVTVGSMATPIGNPQNILVATTGAIANPLGTFLLWLGVPALLSLAFAWAWLRRHHRRPPAGARPYEARLPPPHDTPRAWPAILATVLLVALVIADSLLRAVSIDLVIPYGVASLVACAPIYLFGSRRLVVLRAVDWPTLGFFVAMFVVTGALLASGSLQALLGPLQARLGEPDVTAAVAFGGSQVFSNVPLVQIYLQLLPEQTVPNLMMLAGVSTLAGNLFIISAASNVIVVQQAERHGQRPFTFWQFARIMLPVTLVSLALTWAWVTLLAHLL